MAKRFQIDTNNTLLTSLVSYWTLSDAIDFYGANNLTNTGSVAFTAGKVDNAASFSGINYLSKSTPVTIATTNISVAFWANIPTSSETGCFFWNGKTTATTNGYALGIGGSNYTIAGNNLILHLPSIIWGNFGALGTGWKHIILTRDTATWRAYINNVVSGTTYTNNPGVPSIPGGFFIGSDGGFYMDGQIDEFGFWTKVLSVQERTDLYNAGNGQTMINQVNTRVVIIG